VRERDTSLDLMRFLGVLVLMLAHAGPPDWLFQLRNFGTPLLVVASGATYAVIYRDRALQVVSFLTKRLTRLIVPAWCFLTFFFAFFFAAFSLLDQPSPFDRPYPFSLRQILFSYAFSGGTGISFVWIFKVYVMLALFTPLALKIKAGIPNNTRYFSLLALAYGLYELTVALSAPFIPRSLSVFINNVVFVGTAYALLYLYGMKISELTNRQLFAVSAGSMAVFIAMGFFLAQDQGKFVYTEDYKYPPQLYYLAYAMFALNLAYWACRNYLCKFHYAWVEWLSANSLWIYLWRIFAFYLWKFFLPPTGGYLPLVAAKMAFLIGFGAAATYAQHQVGQWLRQLSTSGYTPSPSR
jgi:peptidoglycan/LPS O-acetylase OafA/YrhL